MPALPAEGREGRLCRQKREGLISALQLWAEIPAVQQSIPEVTMHRAATLRKSEKSSSSSVSSMVSNQYCSFVKIAPDSEKLQEPQCLSKAVCSQVIAA